MVRIWDYPARNDVWRRSKQFKWATGILHAKKKTKRRYRKFPDIIDVIRPLSYWNNDGQFMLVLGVPFRNHQIWCNFPQHFQKSPRFQKSPTFLSEMHNISFQNSPKISEIRNPQHFSLRLSEKDAGVYFAQGHWVAKETLKDDQEIDRKTAS